MNMQKFFLRISWSTVDRFTSKQQE